MPGKIRIRSQRKASKIEFGWGGDPWRRRKNFHPSPDGKRNVELEFGENMIFFWKVGGWKMCDTACSYVNYLKVFQLFRSFKLYATCLGATYGFPLTLTSLHGFPLLLFNICDTTAQYIQDTCPPYLRSFPNIQYGSLSMKRGKGRGGGIGFWIWKGRGWVRGERRKSPIQK